MSLVIVAQTTQLFSKVVLPFSVPASGAEGSSCSPPLPMLGQSFQFQPFWSLCCGILLFFFSLYKMNIYFKNKCMVVNSTIWCHCLYYSCLGNSCLTLHYFCTILGKLYLSIVMKIVLTSWTPWITVLVCTFHPDFTLLIYAPSSDLLKSVFSSAFSTTTKNLALFMCFLS